MSFTRVARWPAGGALPDIGADPFQTANVIGGHSEVAAKMHAACLAFRRGWERPVERDAARRS